MSISFKQLFIELLFFFLLLSAGAAAQTDSLVMSNGDHIVGEIKVMEQGVVQLKTKYSDSDLKIKWDGIKYVKTNQFLLSIL